jgi:hypothetical protein
MELIQGVRDEINYLRPVLEAQGGVAVNVEHFASPFEMASGVFLLPDFEDEEG